MIPRMTGQGADWEWENESSGTDIPIVGDFGDMANYAIHRYFSRGKRKYFARPPTWNWKSVSENGGKGKKIMVQNCICKRRTEYRNPPILGVKFYTSSTSRVPKESLHLARINHEEQNSHVKKKFRRINFSARPNELTCWVLISCLNSPLLTIISPHQILHHRCTRQLCGIT